MKTVSLLVVASALLLGACSSGPASKEDVCRDFDQLSVKTQRVNGFFDNPVFSAAESLADTADRYEAADLSADAKRLHKIADSDSTNLMELMNATDHIADLCGHPLGLSLH